jgi:hypothetical protein
MLSHSKSPVLFVQTSNKKTHLLCSNCLTIWLLLSVLPQNCVKSNYCYGFFLSNGHSTANLSNSSTRQIFANFGEFEYSPKWPFSELFQTRQTRIRQTVTLRRTRQTQICQNYGEFGEFGKFGEFGEFMENKVDYLEHTK